jgi:hypothetical protein
MAYFAGLDVSVKETNVCVALTKPAGAAIVTARVGGAANAIAMNRAAAPAHVMMILRMTSSFSIVPSRAAQDFHVSDYIVED